MKKRLRKKISKKTKKYFLEYLGVGLACIEITGKTYKSKITHTLSFDIFEISKELAMMKLESLVKSGRLKNIS